MIGLMMGGERLMLRAFAILVYPLVGILFFLSLYLIPSWQMPDTSLPELGSFSKTLWLSIPIIVFSFSHAAAISSFVNKQRSHYGDLATSKSEAILKRTSLLFRRPRRGRRAEPQGAATPADTSSPSPQ